MKKIFNFFKAMYILPVACITYWDAVKKAKRMHSENPRRYYVLASSPTELIVTSRDYQRSYAPMSVKRNPINGKSKIATGNTMYADCYYFTPTKKGRIPEDYTSIIESKFKMYIKHQLLYIHAGLR